MKHIQKGKVLILSDIHQNLFYANKAFEEDFDYVIFLGDFLDTFYDIDNITHFSVKNVCKWINTKFEELGDKAIWLSGNHDIVYFASHIPNTFNVKKNEFYNCSGWTKSKASEFNKTINPKWITANELCCKVGDYAVTHAGFHWGQFEPNVSELNAIKSLYYKWEKEKQNFYEKPWHWIWDAGACRGGVHGVGSNVWLDWDREFVPLDGVNQIVGHSTYRSPENKVKQKGNNYNIDAMQNLYCIWENGALEFKWVK